MALAAPLGGSAAHEKRADEKKADEKVLTFKADVAPLFKDACGSCHSGRKIKARLDVTSYDSVVKFVKAGDPDKSKLHKALIGKDAKMMPPKNPLANDQIALVKAWIAGGAKKE
jgi:hypothetical protein